MAPVIYVRIYIKPVGIFHREPGFYYVYEKEDGTPGVCERIDQAKHFMSLEGAEAFIQPIKEEFGSSLLLKIENCYLF